MHNNLYDTFVPLPEFALHIPQLWPRISAKIYLMNQGNWLKGSRWSQIKQKGSNQIFWNGQQGIKLKNADGEPSLACPSQVSKFPVELGPKPPFPNAYGTAYKSLNTARIVRHKHLSEHPSHTHPLKVKGKKSRNGNLHIINLYYNSGQDDLVYRNSIISYTRQHKKMQEYFSWLATWFRALLYNTAQYR